MAELHDVSDASFDAEVLQPGTLALVDFWGDHCPACRQISPILKGLAEDYAGRVKILKLHAAENMRTSARYGVRAMPTVLAFRDGEVRGQLVGARKKSDFEELIAGLLASA
jgi:thioredoxin 1